MATRINLSSAVLLLGFGILVGFSLGSWWVWAANPWIPTRGSVEESTSFASTTLAFMATTSQQEVDWVELRNVKYGYRLLRPIALLVAQNERNDRESQVFETDDASVTILRQGGPGYEWLTISVFPLSYSHQPPRTTSENGHTLSSWLSAEFDPNLNLFLSNLRESFVKKNTSDSQSKLGGIREVVVDGKKGYSFAVTRMYSGAEKLDYPPDGIPTVYTLVEHGGNIFVIERKFGNMISRKMLDSFKFE